MTKNKWINRWIARPLDTAHLILAVVLGVTYAAGLLLPSPVFADIGYWGIFLLILEYLIHKNLNAAYHFLNNTTEVSALPVSQIKSVNLAMLAIHTSLTSAVMLLMPVLEPERGLLWLKDAALWLLRALVSLFAGHPSVPQPLEEPRPDPSMAPLLPIPQKTAPQWMEILDTVLELLFTLLTVAMIAAAVCYGVYRLYRRWMERQRYEGELREFIYPLAKRQAMQRQRQKRQTLWTDFSPNAAMRRLYIRTLKKARPRHTPLPPSATPEELETAVFGSRQNPLHEYYEKARYSREGCTSKDLEKVRKSL